MRHKIKICLSLVCLIRKRSKKGMWNRGGQGLPRISGFLVRFLLSHCPKIFCMHQLHSKNSRRATQQLKWKDTFDALFATNWHCGRFGSCLSLKIIQIYTLLTESKRSIRIMDFVVSLFVGPEGREWRQSGKLYRLSTRKFILLLDFNGGSFDHLESEAPRIFEPLIHLLSLKESLTPGNFSHEL